ncbi:hypothetical protein [Actinocorallia longicatena]|uniref:hypothetical protein n=1 Tax=Actinocorallia longicatena TaxID=111803 RepID=UPI0031D788F6
MRVSRRALLGGGAALATPLVAGVSGCAGDESAQPRPKADVGVLLAAIADEERLIALYEKVAAAHQDLPAHFPAALNHHREHLAALRRHYVPGTGVTPTPVPTTAPPEPPADLGAARTALRQAEKSAAAARVADSGRVAPGVAQLMASIGACEAGHAARLGFA